MTQLVFCDVAGTILEGNPWDYVRQHPKYDQQRGQRELLKFLPFWLGRKAKLVTDTHFRNRWLKGMAAIFEGMPRADVQEIFDDVVNNKMTHLYHHDIIERLHEHQAHGAKVVMISGMFVDMVRLFAERIGADDAIGTPMAYDGEIALGRVGGDTCVGPRKITYIREYLQEHHPDVRIEDCYAYADSYSDRSMLGAVGHGIATYPESELRQVAQAEGWQILPVP
jgi:HAD superfamily hydrolase (TIGR01490 family)